MPHLRLSRAMPCPLGGNHESFRASALWQAGDSGFLLAQERTTRLWRAFSLITPGEPLQEERRKIALHRFRTRREALEVIQALGFAEA